MSGFATTDDRGNFLLDGRPWFLHAPTYLSRRSVGRGLAGELGLVRNPDDPMAQAVLDMDLRNLQGK